MYFHTVAGQHGATTKRLSLSWTTAKIWTVQKTTAWGTWKISNNWQLVSLGLSKALPTPKVVLWGLFSAPLSLGFDPGFQWVVELCSRCWQQNFQVKPLISNQSFGECFCWSIGNFHFILFPFFFSLFLSWPCLKAALEDLLGFGGGVWAPKIP